MSKEPASYTVQTWDGVKPQRMRETGRTRGQTYRRRRKGKYMNFQRVNELLQGRNAQRRKVGNNTYLERREGSAIALQLHDTDIITYSPHGITLNSGGWLTVTTKARLNEHLDGWRVWSEHGVWYVGARGAPRGAPALVFADGMTLVNGKWEGAEPLSSVKERLILRTRVQRYARAYIAAMRTDKVPAPSGGDCWDCAFREAKTDKTMGELKRDNGKDSHLILHLNEKYYVPALLARALEVMPHSQMNLWVVGSKWAPEPQRSELATFGNQEHQWKELAKILSRYMLRQLGQAA